MKVMYHVSSPFSWRIANRLSPEVKNERLGLERLPEQIWWVPSRWSLARPHPAGAHVLRRGNSGRPGLPSNRAFCRTSGDSQFVFYERREGWYCHSKCSATYLLRFGPTFLCFGERREQDSGELSF